MPGLVVLHGINQLLNEFKKMDITEYERFNAIYTKGIGFLGCTMSHLEILKLAKKRNYKKKKIMGIIIRNI